MLRRALLCLLILGFAPSLAAAQQPAASEVVFGVKAGLNSSNIVENCEEGNRFCGSNNRTFKSNKGLMLGGFVRAKLSNKLAIQPEAFISQQGASLGDEKLTITYLQVPVLAVASFPGASATPFVYAGPAVGLKVRARYSDDDISEDAEDIAGTDFSVTLGGGVEFGQFSAELRYTHGLKNVNDEGNGFIDKNRVFSILAGYRFR
jgi:opacity protein-like surface antigen